MDNGKVFKIRGNLMKELLSDRENPRYSLKTPSLKLCNFFSKRNFDTGFEISFVGTMDISSYTQYEQPRVAGTYSIEVSI